jgi:hypothetical protein
MSGTCVPREGRYTFCLAHVYASTTSRFAKHGNYKVTDYQFVLFARGHAIYIRQLSMLTPKCTRPLDVVENVLKLMHDLKLYHPGMIFRVTQAACLYTWKEGSKQVDNERKIRTAQHFLALLSAHGNRGSRIAYQGTLYGENNQHKYGSVPRPHSAQ